MTEWTPELEKYVKKMDRYVEKQSRDLYDSKKTVLGTALRLAFRVAVSGRKAQKKLSQAFGDSAGGWRALFDVVVPFAQQNGKGDLVKNIERGSTLSKQVDEALKDDKSEGMIARIRNIKSLNIKW